MTLVSGRPQTRKQRRMKAPARRVRVIAAALEVFAAKGYHAAAMGEIATAAGITRPVLYDHFPSKRELFLTVLREQDAELAEHVGRHLAGPGTAAERMRATADAYFGFAEDRPAARRLLFSQTVEDDPEIAAVRDSMRRGHARSLTALLAPEEQSRTPGTPGTPGTEATVELIISAVDGLARWWERHPEVPRQELVTAAMRTLWTGVDPQRDQGR